MLFRRSGRVLLALVPLAIATGAGGCGPPSVVDANGGPENPPPRPPEPVFEIAPAPEVARRLARLLWNSELDAELAQALSETRPLDLQAIERMARAMLRDGRAARGVGAFFRWVLDLDRLQQIHRDPMLYPEFGPDLRRALAAEVQAFGVHVVLEGDGRLATLLTAPFAFMNELLAPLYGRPNAGLGAQLSRAPVDPRERLGLLGLAGVLALASEAERSWPSMRGNFLARTVTCNGLWVTPPAGEPKIAPGRSIRAQQLDATRSATCQGCHRLMDNLGFAFLPFDSLGRHSPRDVDVPVDASGMLPEPFFDPEERFHDLPDLARRLSDRKETARCAVRQWRAYAALVTRNLTLSRAQWAQVREETLRAEEPADRPELDALVADFQRAGSSIRELIITLVRTEQFAGVTSDR